MACVSGAYNGRMARRIDQLGKFFSPTDPALLAADAGGARSVASVRVWFILVMAIAPALGFIIQGPDADIEIQLTTIALLLALIYSLIIRTMMEQRDWRPSHAEAYATTTFDLTLISGTLLLLGLVAGPDRVVHSEAVWAVYLLVIMTSALRLDIRICFYAGLLTVIQYLALVAALDLTWQDLMLNYDRLIQFARITLMLAATALAIGIVNRSRSMMTMSGFDSLTGLANRRYFDQRFKDEMSKAEKLERPLSLVLFDLDHFKCVNDEYGHDVGDGVLLQVADLMRRGSREQDFLARWGGEELAMILPDTDAEVATRVAKRLTDMIRNKVFRSLSSNVRLTASAGVAERRADCSTAEDLFSLADQRVLQAKAIGRDQVIST